MISNSTAGFQSLWRDLRQSLAGTEQDFTSGVLGRAITLLAIPMVLETSMQSVFEIFDVLFVARLGANAVVAVGLTESLLTPVFSVALGISMSTAAVMARRVGEKNPSEAAKAAVQAVLLGIGFSIPVSVFGLLYSSEMLARLMGASAGVVSVGWGYNAVMMAANATIILLFLINAIFRGAGDAVIAMRALTLANLLNIVLDPCLIFGLWPFPQLGVTGAVVATNIARALGIAYQLWMLRSLRTRVQVGRERW